MPYLTDFGNIFCGVKGIEREAEHLSPSNTRSRMYITLGLDVVVLKRKFGIADLVTCQGP